MIKKRMRELCVFIAVGFSSIVSASDDLDQCSGRISHNFVSLQTNISDKIDSRAELPGKIIAISSMGKSPDKKKSWDWKDYTNFSVVGMGRGLAGLPIEHPLDCVKTHLQAHPEMSSGMKAFRTIFAEKGIRGFFNGAIPNATRLTIKQAYRYPMMFYFPDMYQNLLPVDFDRQNPTIKKILSGVTIAGLETYVLCPLERLKVVLMTSNTAGRHPIKDFFKDNKGNLGQQLFRGLSALFPKQMVSWVTFLAADHKTKEFAHSWAGVPIHEELPFFPLMAAATVVGVINTTAILPFDCAKTQLQMTKHISSDRFLDAIKTVYGKYGVAGLYRGWQVRMLQYILNSAFTVTVLEKLAKG